MPTKRTPVFRPIPTTPGFKDRTGEPHGLLTVAGYAGSLRIGRDPKRYSYWWCQCACGRYTRLRSSDLVSGNTRSCGPCGRHLWSHAVTHGHTRLDEQSPTYTAYHSMKARCRNKSNPAYPSYGGAGVKVCARWLDSFEAFLADMGERPSLRHSIDRIENAKGYEPGNCRWATRKEQGRNQTTNRRLTHRGETRCLSDWAEHLGLSRSTLWARIAVHGWSVERALSTPSLKKRKRRRRRRLVALPERCLGKNPGR